MPTGAQGVTYIIADWLCGRRGDRLWNGFGVGVGFDVFASGALCRRVMPSVVVMVSELLTVASTRLSARRPENKNRSRVDMTTNTSRICVGLRCALHLLLLFCFRTGR